MHIFPHYGHTMVLCILSIESYNSIVFLRLACYHKLLWNFLRINLSFKKRDNTLNFRFLLDQKLRKFTEISDVIEQMNGLSEVIMACVDRFAPEKPWIGCNKSNEWTTNKLKNSINKREDFFQLWTKNPLSQIINFKEKLQ